MQFKNEEEQRSISHNLVKYEFQHQYTLQLICVVLLNIKL